MAVRHLQESDVAWFSWNSEYLPRVSRIPTDTYLSREEESGELARDLVPAVGLLAVPRGCVRGGHGRMGHPRPGAVGPGG